MLDLLLQDRDLGVVEFLVRTTCRDFIDQELGAIVLDVGFFKKIIVDFAF